MDKQGIEEIIPVSEYDEPKKWSTQFKPFTAHGLRQRQTKKAAFNQESIMADAETNDIPSFSKTNNK